MKRVFISYNEPDRVKVSKLIEVILSRFNDDFELWVDRPNEFNLDNNQKNRLQKIPLGTDWQKSIITSIEESDCLLAFWSKAAVELRNPIFLREIDLARMNNKCIQVTLDNLPISQVPPPYTFDQITVLTKDVFGKDAYLFDDVLDDIEARFLSAHPGGFYAETFIRQFENHGERRNEPALINAMQRSDLFKNYITTQCTPLESRKTAVADVFLNNWLRNSKRKFIALIGDYGSGKTSVCLRLTYNFLRTYETSDKTARAIPVFISMRDLAYEPGNEEGLFFSLISGHYKFPINDIWGLQEYCDKHRCVLILDGLDEVTKTLSVETIKGHLDGLRRVFGCFNKVILTARSTIFNNKELLYNAFPVEASDYTFLNDILPGDEFDIAITLPTPESEVFRYIHSHVKNSNWFHDIWKLITTKDEVKDFCSRPVFLSMVGELIANGPVDAAPKTVPELYTLIITCWLQRETTEKRAKTSVDRKSKFLEELAYSMLNSNLEAFHFSAIEGMIDKFSEKANGQTANLINDEFQFDLINSSILANTLDDYYEFSHRSFLEFFAAKYVASKLLDCDISAISNLLLSPMMVDALIYFIDDSNGRAKIISFLSERLDLSSVKERSCFPANAAVILLNLGCVLGKTALSGKNLKGGNFSNLQLSGLDIQESIFDEANLTNTNFEKSDLSKSSFRNAFLMSTNFRDARLDSADFWNIRMVAGPPAIWQSVYLATYQLFLFATDSGWLQSSEIGCSTGFDAVNLSDTGLISVASWNDKTIAIADRDRNVHLLDITLVDGSINANYLDKLRFRDNVRAMSYSHDGTLLVGSRDGELLSIKTLENNELLISSMSHHVNSLMSVAWSRCGRYFASGGYDFDLCVWDSAEPRHPSHLIRTISENAHGSIIRAVCFSDCGNIFCSSDESGVIKVWRFISGKLEFLDELILEKGVFSISIVPNGEVVFGLADGSIGMWNFKDGILTCKNLHKDIVRSISHFEDSVVATTSWDGRAFLVDVNKLEVKETLIELKRHPLHSNTGESNFDNCSIRGILGMSSRFVEHLTSLGAKLS